VIFRQGCQQERQPRRARVVLKNRAVHSSKESIHINIHFVFLPAVAVMHCHACTSTAALGSDSPMRFGQLTSKCIRNGSWSPWSQINLIKDVTIPLEELNGSTSQPKDLITVCRLKNTEERFRMKAVCHYSQLSDGSLQLVDSKQVGCTQY